MVWLGFPIALVAAVIGSLITVPAYEILHPLMVAPPDDQFPETAAIRHLLEQVLLVVFVLLPGVAAFGGWFTFVKKHGLG